MIFRLEYKNKALKTARVDIITPTGTGVETVEGTGYPFQLKYEGDKKNKSLMFLSSSAEINIYETPLFNIDTLKTSGEKDIRVNYYIDSVLEWTGFVIPDFFSREIGGDGVVSMVASDRLSVLDSEVLEGLPVTVTLRTLLSSSLAKTGLVLPLKTVVDFATVSGNTDHLLNHSIRSQRLTDTKGRSVNCKDIIKSILAATNSKLMQRKGEWWVINKMQHELGGGRVYTSPTAFTNYVEDLISFTDVTRGAMRTIAPVAGGVGVFQEYGGGALAPDNYAFESGLSNWTLHNGFTASTDNRRVLGYTQSGNVTTPIYDSPGTAMPYLVNRNLLPGLNIGLNDVYTIPHARTSIPVISANPFSAKIKVEVNATGRGGGDGARFVVILKRPGRDNLILNRNGQWQGYIGVYGWLFASFTGEELEAVDGNGSRSGTIDAAGDEGFEDDINDYSIDLLIFGSGRALSDGTTVIRDETVLINSASVQFSAASNDNPKGTLYKADQGGESYTKIHDTETTVFGDYLTGGLNGYFYNYAPDDTSSLLAPNGSRSQPAWVNTYTQNTEPLPLLQQTIRQMRRMFSVAHDFIKGEIDVADFDPLSVFEDCERRFVIVEAEFDFLRGSLQVVLEEVAYQNLTVREYIYSYFGEGDEGIRGISGISAGSSGGGGGGGIAPEPSWLENEITIDPESGLLSVDGWHVKGDLIIEGQVNQWLAQQLVVDDARIQVNRRQDGATVDSGLVIYNKDTSSEVSSLVYDVNGIWRAGGQRIYTDAYKPDSDALGGIAAALYATKNWVETEAVAYDSARLGGYSAASYPRKAEDAVISGKWTFADFLNGNLGIGVAANERLHVAGNGLFTGSVKSGNIITGYGAGNQIENIGIPLLLQYSSSADVRMVQGGGRVGIGINPQEKLHVDGNTLITGAVTAGGNVGTSNFASQLQGWRVNNQGAADFRHIYTDELQAKAFTADISQALVGSDVLTKSVAKLAQNFTVTTNGTTAPLYVEELEGFAGMQVFAVNDILLIRIFDRSGGGLLIKNVWVEVASYVGTTNNVQQFTVNVINSGGIAGQVAYAGSMILDYGQSGSGLIQRTVLDQQGSPYSRVTTWENNPWTPENFTLHYQSGNLNGLANAEGWGVYSQNSFLTGKLLVGDLTKAGQYMEYENGLLNVKGNITVTGGNAATKEDVDAGIAAAAASTSALAARVENTLGLAQLEGINQTLITGGKVRTALLEATDIVAQGITAGHVEGLTLDFDKGTIGGWNIQSAYLESGTGKMRLGGGSVPYIQMRPDWAVTANDLLIYATSPTNWGIVGKVEGAEVFRLGSTNQIAGFEFGGQAFSHRVGGSFIAMNNHATASATAGGQDSKIYRGFGIYRNDTEIDGAPDALRAIRIGKLATPADDIPDAQEGIQITRRINNVDKDVFRIDGDSAFIASVNFSDSEMWGSFPNTTPSFEDSPARLRLSSLGQGDREQPFVEVGLRSGRWSHMGRFGIASVEMNVDNVQRPLTQITHNGVRCNYYSQNYLTSTTTYTEMQNNRIRVVYAGSSRFEAYYNNNVLQLFARDLPTNASGLASGQIWRDATGTLKIV